MSLRLRERSNTRLISARGSSAVNDRYLRYADVCAFHHYPAWHPANEPGNMDEVKQVPLIWEAFARAVAETFPEKPLLIIEAPAAYMLIMAPVN
ncbi:Beta-glucuronidase [Durusdinium trenchii]|uniref:Beta-glucuronidase n=1 Tax=Durusdinium trenchii TaxID=1381693 RepID=A0ABP0KLT5_9DINO